ncbi:hypothetical protein ACOBV8_18575 (plasmid) [Pseudoalteromonas espejiana]
MAAHLDLKAGGRGVENKEQLDIVQSIGFKYIQEFLLSQANQFRSF